MDRIACSNFRVCAALAFVTALLLVGTASAASFPYRDDLNRTSRVAGIGPTEVPLLQRQPGRGARVVADEILRRYRDSRSAITTSGEYTQDVSPKRVRYIGASGWYLQVYGDGTAVRYRNYPYLDSAADLGRPVAARLSDERLEALGRAFIARELAGYVTLAKGEEVVAFSSVHEINGSQENVPGSSAKRREEVVSSQVNFSRTVRGVAVVGRGSKVSVIFANNGVPLGFDLDWPTYAETGESQPVLGVTDINRRASSVLTVNPFGTGATIRRYECGYFDAGARRRDAAAPIQASCFLHYVVQTVGDTERNKLDPTDGLEKAGYAQPIPVGVRVKADQGWPEAMLLCTGAPGCGTRPPSLRPAPAYDLDPKLEPTKSSDAGSAPGRRAASLVDQPLRRA